VPFGGRGALARRTVRDDHGRRVVRGHPPPVPHRPALSPVGPRLARHSLYLAAVWAKRPSRRNCRLREPGRPSGTGSDVGNPSSLRSRERSRCRRVRDRVVARLSGDPSTQTLQEQAMPDNTAIRSFQVSFPEADVTELRRRIRMTRWPEHELVSDAASRRIWSTPAAVGPTQGVQLATMQKLIQYWGTDYDWTRCEAHLKSLPHFMTQIDGLDIHFIHVKSKHQNALPMIVTHGWPGSVIEQLKIIEPLTNPTGHGGTEADAFHLVIPSLPGYGFSGKPTETGWDPERIARAWIVLMKRLGYNRYVAQGGDWGALITEQMALIAPPELIAIH